MPDGVALDVTQPWRLQLLAQRAFGARDKAFLTFDLSYELPQAYLKPAPVAAARRRGAVGRRRARAAEPPMWQAMWRAKTGQIAVLLARHRPAHR